MLISNLDERLSIPSSPVQMASDMFVLDQMQLAAEKYSLNYIAAVQIGENVQVGLLRTPEGWKAIINPVIVEQSVPDIMISEPDPHTKPTKTIINRRSRKIDLAYLDRDLKNVSEIFTGQQAIFVQDLCQYMQGHKLFHSQKLGDWG